MKAYPPVPELQEITRAHDLTAVRTGVALERAVRMEDGASNSVGEVRIAQTPPPLLPMLRHHV